MMASFGENVIKSYYPFCKNSCFHAQNTSSRSGYPDIPYYVCLHCDLLAHLIFNRNEHEINLSKIMWLCSIFQEHGCIGIFQENVIFRHHFHWAPLLIPPVYSIHVLSWINHPRQRMQRIGGYFLESKLSCCHISSSGWWFRFNPFEKY